SASPRYLFSQHTATTSVYTLSLHDALPIYWPWQPLHHCGRDVRRLRSAAEASFAPAAQRPPGHDDIEGLSGRQAQQGDWVLAKEDRKSTRLNSSHLGISYAVFCLKKKNKIT